MTPRIDFEAHRRAPRHADRSLQLLQQLGEGGLGVVYLAEQQEPVRRQVALKIIRPGMDTREVITRFEAERQALALMDHPNIARVLDAGATESGRPYFVMELVHGIPITEYCDQHEMSIRERLELFVPVCQAVQHAHHKGIIHRDLKPSNILVSVRRRRAGRQGDRLRRGQGHGSQAHRQGDGHGPGPVGGHADVHEPRAGGAAAGRMWTRAATSIRWACCCMNCLTGTPPFDKERFREAGYDEICAIIREEEPPKPSTRITTVAEAADDDFRPSPREPRPAQPDAAR